VSDNGGEQRPGSGLAARFKQAHEAQERAQQAREAELRAKETARVARAALFDDLAAFARDTGFVAGDRRPDGVVLRFESRELRFTEDGDGDGVAVAWSDAPKGSEHRLYREPMLADRWIWRFVHRGREQRLPLFDQGLQVLLVQALGLPDPG
jgi:hypothetical protein